METTKQITTRIADDLKWLREQLVEEFLYDLSIVNALPDKQSYNKILELENIHGSGHDYAVFQIDGGLLVYFKCKDYDAMHTNFEDHIYDSVYITFLLKIQMASPGIIYGSEWSISGIAIRTLIKAYVVEWRSASVYEALQAAGIQVFQKSLPEEDTPEFSNPYCYYNLLALSHMTYEKSYMNAYLLFVSYSNALANKNAFNIWLTNPVEIKNYRLARKLIQISSNSLYAVCTQSHILGFVNRDEALQFNDDTDECWHFIMQITRSKWIASMNSPDSTVRLFTYSNGLFQYGYKEQLEYISPLKTIFPKCNIKALECIIESAIKQANGAMIVVTEKAKSETVRLSDCCISIDPIFIDSIVSEHITAIDGALICDPQGVCYAIGVILDGEHSSGNGESIDRGARHNSAKRYSHWLKEKCLILIVSEDGDVSIVKSD